MTGSCMRNIVLAGMTVCLLVPFLLVSWLNYNASRHWAREEITQTALPLTRDTIYSEIHGDLAQPLYVSSTMANDSFLKEWAADGEQEPDRVIRYLREIHEKYGYFSVFYVSDRSHTYYHYAKGKHKTISPDDEHDVWYYSFVKRGKEYELDVDSDEAGGNALTIFINFRVEDQDGALLGVTGVGMKMDTVARQLTRAGDRWGRSVYLIDEKGVIQAHVDQSLIESANLRDRPGARMIADEVLTRREGVTNLQYQAPAGRVYLTSRYIPEFNWFLIVEQAESPALANARYNFLRTLAAGACIWFALLMLILWSARSTRRRLETLARTDPLTGLHNRRRFDEEFAIARAVHERNRVPFAVLLIDLDKFKLVNDRLGHLSGDALIQAIAKAMAATLRPTDRIARWGGDEFIILAMGTAAETQHLAERLRLVVRDTAAGLATAGEGDPRRSVSISCGLVPLRAGATLDDLTHAADELLYACKQRGGDAILCAEES